MSEPRRFISLEDEITLRRAVRMAYKHEGMAGVYKCMGELNHQLKIVAEIARELLEEEEKINGL